MRRIVGFDYSLIKLLKVEKTLLFLRQSLPTLQVLIWAAFKVLSPSVKIVSLEFVLSYWYWTRAWSEGSLTDPLSIIVNLNGSSFRIVWSLSLTFGTLLSCIRLFLSVNASAILEEPAVAIPCKVLSMFVWLILYAIEFLLLSSFFCSVIFLWFEIRVYY